MQAFGSLLFFAFSYLALFDLAIQRCRVSWNVLYVRLVAPFADLDGDRHATASRCAGVKNKEKSSKHLGGLMSRKDFFRVLLLTKKWLHKLDSGHSFAGLNHKKDVPHLSCDVIESNPVCNAGQH